MPKPVSILIRPILVFALCSSLLSSRSAAYGQSLGTISVEAGDYQRIDTPVSLDLSGVAGIGFPLEELSLLEIKGSQRLSVPVQFEAGSPPRLWWVLSGTTAAGATRTYELVKGGPRSASGVGIRRDAKVIEIEKDGTKVLSYNHAIVPPPAGQSELYNRSAFIHPLWSPAGSVLTNIHPADHYHHVGIWMPWTKTKFEGKAVDFWNLNAGQGTVRFKRFLSRTSGPVFGGFQAEHDHVALQTADGEKIVLKDSTDNTIQEFTYDDEGDWPAEPDGDGPTLEVIDVTDDYDEPLNWVASDDWGGTPGEATDVTLATDYLMALLLDGPSHAATFQLFEDGSFTYTPEEGWTGTDTFTFKASDGADESEVVTVTIEVTEPEP